MAAAGVVAAAYLLRARRPKPMVYSDPREERLVRSAARTIGCPPEDILTAVRREMELSPAQSDDTLLKRAMYHYRQDVPERTCQTYRDRQPG